MKSFNLANLVYNLITALLIGAFLQPLTGLDSVATASGIFLLGVTYSLYTKSGRANLKGLFFSGIQQEIWTDHIESEIFKDNTFLKFCKKVGAESILGGRVVHIQQSGGKGNVVKNRKNLPAKSRIRQDNDVIYLLDDYTTDPVVIPFTSEKELSPEYRNSVLGEDRDALIEETAENGILSWLSSDAYSSYGVTTLPAANILSSTGADGANNNPLGNANRKLTTINDLQRMRKYFKSIDRWFEGKMYALLDPQQEIEMFPADSLTTATYMQNVSEEERRNGIMYKAQGWNIMSRSSVVNLDNAGALKVPGEALVATDDAASMFWYKDAVEYTVGGIEAFFKFKDPNNYGDVFSFLVYSGGRARRADYKGVGLLKQAKTA